MERVRKKIMNNLTYELSFMTYEYIYIYGKDSGYMNMAKIHWGKQWLMQKLSQHGYRIT